MACIDGFVAAVPTANRAKYKAHTEYAAAVLREHGATRVVECWGDDVPGGGHEPHQLEPADAAAVGLVRTTSRRAVWTAFWG
jgi:uncharacterized protein YbaA (DUF1428 family)